MRSLRFVLCVCIFSCYVVAKDEVTIPKGVRYEKASVEVNEKAKTLLKARLSAKARDGLSLFGKLLVCGPGLWQEIKDDASMAKLKEGVINIQVPVLNPDGSVKRTDSLPGKLLQSPEEVATFWKVLMKHVDFSAMKIRKLNEDEIALFWAMIPFDISEPLFILETKRHKILVVLTSKDKLEISWIDDYQKLSLRKPDADRAAAGDHE